MESRSVTAIQNLKNTINSLNIPKRAVLTNYIELSAKVSIGVKAYKLFSSQSPVKMTSICRFNEKLEFVERKSIAVALVCILVPESVVCETKLLTSLRKQERHWNRMKFVELSNLVAIIFPLCRSKFSKFDILIFLVSFQRVALCLYVTNAKD